MYETSFTFNSTNGWRYLGKDSLGKHLLISTGIPMKLTYEWDKSASWWDNGTYAAAKAAAGMLKNLESISYSSTTVGAHFKVSSSTYASKVEKVRTLTLAELNTAVNNANGNTNRPLTSSDAGFKDLTGKALGLFDMKDLSNYNTLYSYWIATAGDADIELDDVGNIIEPAGTSLYGVNVFNGGTDPLWSEHDYVDSYAWRWMWNPSSNSTIRKYWIYRYK